MINDLDAPELKDRQHLIEEIAELRMLLRMGPTIMLQYGIAIRLSDKDKSVKATDLMEDCFAWVRQVDDLVGVR